MGFFLNPTSKGPKGLADMGCKPSAPCKCLLHPAGLKRCMSLCPSAIKLEQHTADSPSQTKAIKASHQKWHVKARAWCEKEALRMWPKASMVACRPSVSALTVPRGVLRVLPGCAGVHPGERHACQSGRRAPDRVDRWVHGRGICSCMPLLPCQNLPVHHDCRNVCKHFCSCCIAAM